MHAVDLHPHAAEDLRQIMQSDPDSGGKIVALIRQMKADQGLQDKLLAHNSSDENINVKHWWEHYKKGLNLWRLKSIAPEAGPLKKYRVIYAYILPAQGMPPKYCVLAVVHRDQFNYEPGNQITQRILQDYNQL